MRPQLADLGVAFSRIEHRHPRFIAIKVRMQMHGRQLAFVQAFQHPRRFLDPARERLAVDGDAIAGKNLHLAIKRRIPAVFGRDDMADEGGRGHAAIDKARRSLRLHDHFLASPAGVFWADRTQDPNYRGNPVKRFAGRLADAMQLSGAARTIH